MSLLEVRGISKTYPGASRPSIDEVGFSLNEGEVLGLVGESGSGKTTTARCVAGLMQPDSGSIILDGFDVVGAKGRGLRNLRRDMQMVFQDPYSSLNPRMTVLDLVAEGMIVHRIERDSRRRRDRVVGLLDTVGLDAEYLDRHPRSLSGGQRQRVAIARALAVEPRLLVCDEPVSSLDVSVQAQVLNLLRDLRRDLGLSILFIAHDLAVVHYLCDTLAVMSNGRVVESGPRDTVFDDPQHAYTRSLLAAVPVPDPELARARQSEQRRALDLELAAAPNPATSDCKETR